MRTKREQALLEALEDAAVQHGLELVDVELSGSGAARIVRVLLDDPASSIGPTIETLATATAWVEVIVDELTPSAGHYTLEVSSPGIDRPLRTPAHFARFAHRGETVQLRTAPLEGRGSWTGELLAFEQVDGQGFVVIGSEGAHGNTQERIPFERIQKARIKGRIDFKGNDDRTEKADRDDRKDEDVI